MSWREKQSCHIQLEILINFFNTLFAHLIPILLLIVLVLSVASSVLIVRIDSRISMNLTSAYIVLAGIAVGPSVTGLVLLRHTEILFTDSEALAGDTIECITAQVLSSLDEQESDVGNVAHKIVGIRRRYRRRPLAIKVGTFMQIKVGLGVAFSQIIIDNTFTWVFMVAMNSPVWLL